MKSNSVSTVSGKIKIKIVLLGNQSVGKSSIIQKYVKDLFDETSNPTVGIDFLVKNVIHKGKAYRLQLWDTAGQERFRSLIPNYLKDAKCALIVIDVTSKTSLESAGSWLKMYNDNKLGDGFAFLIGNKIDLDYRQVTKQQGKKKAQELGIPYYELSAKTGENIESLFYKIVQISQDNPSGSARSLQTPEQKAHQIKQNAQQQEQDGKQKKNTAITPTVDHTNIILKNEKIVNKNKDTEKKKKSLCC